MPPLLEVRKLRKVYKDTIAVREVSFSVERGICLGLLGPNGAGKTTTIEIVEDIIPASSGTVFYKGAPRSDSFREEIGIQFQHTSLLNFLSVEETLKSFHRLFSHPVDLEPLIARCQLETLRKRKNDKLSGGQLQRLMLALALINDPDLVFLDEPSTGLDPQSRHNLWQIVEQIKDEGKTVILTTHSMEEAQQLCDEIAIMDSGLIIAEGSPRQLIDTYCKTSTMTLPAKSLSDIGHKPELAAHLQWEVHDGKGIIYTDSIDRTLHLLTSNDIALAGINIHNPTLEDVFLHLTGKTLRD